MLVRHCYTTAADVVQVKQMAVARGLRGMGDKAAVIEQIMKTRSKQRRLYSERADRSPSPSRLVNGRKPTADCWRKGLTCIILHQDFGDC